MTDTEIRIAIAQACGWRLIGTAPDGSDYGYPPNGLPVESCSEETVPDYLNDLNACWQFEETLSMQERTDFADYLWHMVDADFVDEDGQEVVVLHESFNLVHATARQRCESFLKVKGLWK